MEYLDFSSVITIIRKYINDERTVVDRNLNEEVKIDQMHLLDQIFASFCDDADSLDFAFDNGQVCRWFNDYICKYLPIEVAKSSISNHQIWMKKTEICFQLI